MILSTSTQARPQTSRRREFFFFACLSLLLILGLHYYHFVGSEDEWIYFQQSTTNGITDNIQQHQQQHQLPSELAILGKKSLTPSTDVKKPTHTQFSDNRHYS
ncbi:hypothetical protein NH340_JMT01799 [Sarcoptes scabiei]|nr:hypothetical protein NH340_JMT01799 [Sarcoptes scabiei]